MAATFEMSLPDAERLHRQHATMLNVLKQFREALKRRRFERVLNDDDRALFEAYCAAGFAIAQVEGKEGVL